MPYLNDRVIDAGLTAFVAEANRIDLCHTDPTTYAQATATYSVGNKTAITLTGPAAGATSGRKATVPAITGGTITATSTGTSDDAQFWAITDTVNSRLLWTGTLSAAQLVTIGNTWSLASFDLTIRGLT